MQIRHLLRALSQRMLPCLVAFSAVLLVSCYPYPENQPSKPKATSRGVVTKPATEKSEADKLKEQEQLAKDKEKEKKAKDDLKKAEAEKDKQAKKDGTGTGDGDIKEPDKDKDKGKGKDPKVDPPVKPIEYEVAKKVPGHDGFVLSPYNKKEIDVRGFKTGALVRDPFYPPEEKKYFRVP